MDTTSKIKNTPKNEDNLKRKYANLKNEEYRLRVLFFGTFLAVVYIPTDSPIVIIDSAVDTEHKEPDNVEEDTTENKINNINSHLVVIVGEDDEVADEEVDEVDHQPGNQEGRLG